MAHVQHIMPDNGKNSWISLSLSAHWNTHIQERNVPCSKQLKLYQLWESINYHRQEIRLFLSITEKKQTKIVYSDAIEVFCVCQDILGDLKADMQLKPLCNTISSKEISYDQKYSKNRNIVKFHNLIYNCLNPSNLHIAQELMINFALVLRRHIYVAKCKWSNFNKTDSYPIRPIGNLFIKVEFKPEKRILTNWKQILWKIALEIFKVLYN